MLLVTFLFSYYISSIFGALNLNAFIAAVFKITAFSCPKSQSPKALTLLLI